MYVPCILSGNAVPTWFKSMRMLFGRLKENKSGHALKPTPAWQVWTLNSFKFLEAHLMIRMDTRRLGKVVVPTEEEEEMMTVPPVYPVAVHAALARCPVVHRPALLRLAPVMPVTGGPRQRTALALARGWPRPYSSWLIG